MGVVVHAVSAAAIAASQMVLKRNTLFIQLVSTQRAGSFSSCQNVQANNSDDRMPKICVDGAIDQAAFSATTPITTAPTPAQRRNVNFSLSNRAPIRVAKSTDVSLSDATSATGAFVIAHTDIA